MEMASGANNRIEWIDTAKGIGLLLVIFGHLHVPYVATWIYFFHMPLFFFLSGMVYSGQKYSFKEYLLRRVKLLVIPYFTFGIIIWVFYAIVNCFVSPEQSLYGSNIEMLKELIVQEHFWTIWFLTALFLVEMIYYLIDKVIKQNKFALMIVSLLLCSLGLLRYRLGLGSLPWNLDIALVAQFFFHIGREFRRSQLMIIVSEGNRRKLVMFMMGFLFVNVLSGGLGIKIAYESLDMSVGLYGNELLTFISAFSGIFFTVILAKMLPLYGLKYLGKNTMVIFALHSRVIIVLCGYLYDAIGVFQGEGIIDQILYASVTFFIIMLILIPVTELIKKSRVRFLFGVT